MPLDAPAQSTISSYFKSSTTTPKKPGKRINSPIDLTSEGEDDAAPSKKPRLEMGSDDTNGRHATSSFADEWRYSPEKDRQYDPNRPRTSAEKHRHEAFKKRLLQDNSHLLQEHREVVDVDQDEPMVVDKSSESDNESEDRFQKLSEMFSNPAKSARAKATSKRPIARSSKGKAVEILQLKRENEGTVLFVEVGYKYVFYGDDAKIAAKELGMVAHMDRNFLVASIPVHRRDVHLKKLLSRGYRVGIISQIETAALKKISDNRNAPFERRLTHLYTAATSYVDDLDSVDEVEKYAVSPFMCLVETKNSDRQADVSIGMITICPSTGDVVWDCFDDTIMRLELETRLVHTRPSELLLPKRGLSEATSKMLSHFTGLSSSGQRTRTEQIKGVMDYTEAFSRLSKFYTDETKFGSASDSFKSGRLMAEITDLPKQVVVALAHAIEHLSKFGIAGALLETKFFTKFSTRAHMLLAANTLTNLEIYRNETDNTTHGSLMWVLDRTKTKFGARLLRSWVGRPLVDKRVLEERITAVQEIVDSDSSLLETLRGTLRGLPDLAKGLCRIQYSQCTPKELSILLPAFAKIAEAFDEVDRPEDVGFKSTILNDIISSLPKLKGPMKELMSAVRLKEAAEGRKETMWTDEEKYPDLIDNIMALQVLEKEFDDELKAGTDFFFHLTFYLFSLKTALVRKKLRMPSLEWTTIAIDEYLVEVKRSEKRPIPDNWILHSKTKNYARYQPPSVREKLEERAQRRETLEAKANEAYRSFLKEISQHYYAILRDTINKLAVADCLTSLAQVALQKDYVRPEFTNDDRLEIVDGRHPMIESFNEDPYVPNSIDMGGEDTRAKIITGPNMGGKSSCVRMIALIALMAQIGSYVPAASVKMGLLDSILTRMGASDDLARGRSTFMVEMSETSEILQTATSKSLVILDELGRGTSTFDGMAIADATLQYLVQNTKCKTLFITHYPLLAAKLENKFPRDVSNLHMGYIAESRIDGTRNITFLYRLTAGLATESFGIECARLAQLPETILSVAAERASAMQDEVQKRGQRNRWAKGPFTVLIALNILLQKAPYLIQDCLSKKGILAAASLDDLQTVKESIENSI
ncbi:LOW QUALITY PROTEIN: hypothetical protein CVT26_012571 [Gymnopilus dilepis]|uniref:MutS protein homolog 3 n=1 Tax=Gymnopilus dilepis TaxID=231916 RepID=A0A409WMS0_9AGAR|nr:LOW QUALITY PROTEIN: hypothetical protein CVT26_012571 [Gymnopilus dilepis]